MSCDRTTELLPWFLNGSLEEAERRLVDAHLAGCAACREELAATGRALALYGQHLPVEVVLGLAEEPRAATWPAGAATVTREAAEGHVAHCSTCREEIELARRSRAEVETGGGGVAPLVPFAEAAGRRKRFGGWHGLALAASIALAVIAAGGWLYSGGLAERRAERIAELERRLAESGGGAVVATAGEELAALEDQVAAAARRAAELEERLGRTAEELAGAGERLAALEQGRRALRGGATVSFLVGAGALRGDEGGVPAVPAAPGEAVFFLDLALVEETGPFHVAVADERGRVLVERGGLAAVTGSLGRQLTVIVPTADLPAGPLTLRLSAGGRELGRFAFRLAG